MKLFAVLASFASVSAFAAEKPVIVKTNHTGFVAPEWARTEICSVYSDRVVIEKRMGRAGDSKTMTVLEERTISISGLAGVIESTKTEKLEQRDNNLCDGPSTVIEAHTANGSVVKLFSTGGCGSPMLHRVGGYSNMLVRTVDSYCSETQVGL